MQNVKHDAGIITGGIIIITWGITVGLYTPQASPYLNFGILGIVGVILIAIVSFMKANISEDPFLKFSISITEVALYLVAAACFALVAAISYAVYNSQLIEIIISEAVVVVGVTILIGGIRAGTKEIGEQTQSMNMPPEKMPTQATQATNLTQSQPRSLMADAFCMRCKRKVEVKNGREEILKNKRKVIVGICPDCGTKVTRMI